MFHKKTIVGGSAWRWAAIIGISWAHSEVSAQDFWFEGGPIARGGFQVRVAGSSYAQTFGLHSAPAPLASPAGVGSPTAYSDRLYNDGYVKLDAGTLNPNAIGGPGNTWNWAYNNSGQFNSGANTLAFHQPGDPGYTTLRNDPVTGQAEATAPGLQLLMGWNWVKNEVWRVDFAIGFQGVWGATSRLGATSYLERKSRLDVTDVYDVASTVDPVTGFPLPQTAPSGYQGSYGNPGPAFSNTPSSRSTQRTDLSTAANQMNFRFDTDLYEITLGPRITWEATSKIHLNLTPKLGVSYISMTADRTEVLTETATGGGTSTLGTWHDHRTAGVWRFTTGLTAGADVDLGKGYYAGIFGGYQWTVDDVRIAIGPNTASLNPSGFVAGLVLGRRF